VSPASSIDKVAINIGFVLPAAASHVLPSAGSIPAALSSFGICLDDAISLPPSKMLLSFPVVFGVPSSLAGGALLAWLFSCRKPMPSCCISSCEQSNLKCTIVLHFPLPQV
jgi:hypothetical protein